MKLQLKFCNISRVDRTDPRISVVVNNKVLYKGKVKPVLDLEFADADYATMSIDFTNKLPEHTKVDSQGNITADLSFELESIEIDSDTLEEFIWDSYYLDHDNNRNEGCLFFGPPGQFHIEFDLPLLKHKLRLRHEKNFNYPHWEEDFNYYITAKEMLAQREQKTLGSYLKKLWKQT